MKSMYKISVFACLWLFFTAEMVAADPSALVVFDIESRGPKLKKDVLPNMTEYLGVLLAEEGYRVVSREKVQEALAIFQEKKIACKQHDCHSKLTRKLTAGRFLKTSILKIAGNCKLVAQMFVVGDSIMMTGAASGSQCSETALTEAVALVAKKLGKNEQERRSRGRIVIAERVAEPEDLLKDEDAIEDDFTPVTWGTEMGRLSLNSIPWGGIWINGKDLGETTPLYNHELPAGRHQISIRSRDGGVMTAIVEIWPNESTSLIVRSVKEEKSPGENTGLLLLNTTPWSQVSIDDKHVGMTPISRRMGPGEYRIKMTFAHGEELAEEVMIRTGRTTKLIRQAKTEEDFSYKKGMGLIKLHSSPWGRVWIDGKDLGMATPVFSTQLSAGRHELSVYFSSGGFITEDVLVKPKETVRKIVREK